MTRQLFAWLAIALIACSTPWIRGQDTGRPLGERVAAQEAQTAQHAQQIRDLQVLPERVATVQSRTDLILAGLVAALGILASIAVILWRAGTTLHNDAAHIRATGHRLSSFMEAARMVPEIADEQAALARRQTELEKRCEHQHGPILPLQLQIGAGQ